MSIGLCQCGCGRSTGIAKQTDTKRGNIKGEPVRWIAGHNIKPSSQSYRYTYRPGHHHASSGGRVRSHIHFDRNKANNANSNLVICQDSAYHSLLHVRQRVIDAGGDPNTQRVCSACEYALPFDCFYWSGRSTGGACKECRRQRDIGRRRDGARRRAA
jgi:hypothetical protein